MIVLCTFVMLLRYISAEKPSAVILGDSCHVHMGIQCKYSANTRTALPFSQRWLYRFVIK